MSERRGYVHRKAVYDLVVNGRSIQDDVVPRLMSLGLTERRGADADELEIVLSDHDGALEIPPAGAEITLKLGWLDLTPGATPQLTDKGSFKVDERGHDGSPDRLTIRARSADLARAFRNRRSHTWRETTLGTVLNDIAGRNGMQARVAAALGGVVVDHLVQGRESDAALLSRLGRLHDAVATVKANRLLFAPIGSGETAGGVEIPPASITRASGDRHRWKAAERDNYSGVTAEWQDRRGGRRRSVTVGGGNNAKKLGRTYSSEKTARRAADSHRQKQDRKGAEFSLELAVGRPDLFPERTLAVSGFKPEIDAASWLITETRHQLDASGGLKTSLQMELGNRPARAS